MTESTCKQPARVCEGYRVLNSRNQWQCVLIRL